MSSGNQRCIVITGVSRGLGRALTGKFAQDGHVVAGCARSDSAIQELTLSLGPPHRFRAVDVSDDNQVRSWAEELIAAGHVPDLLINNAGLINRNAPLWDLAADETDRVVDVNINGVINVIRHFAPAMIAQRQGIIVNLSSGWGRSVAPEVAPYCATKWAVEGLTQALAEELPSGMAAVPVNPGIIDTDMLQSCFGSHAAAYPSAEEWAHGAAPFLLNLNASNNGQSLTV